MPTRPAATSPIPGRPTAAGAIRRPPAGTATRPARLTVPTRALPARTRARRVPTPVGRPWHPDQPRPAAQHRRPSGPGGPPPSQAAGPGYQAARPPRPRAGAVTVAPPPRRPRRRQAWATRTAATWTRPRRPPRPGPGPGRAHGAAALVAVSGGPAAGQRQQLPGIHDRPDGRLLRPVRSRSRQRARRLPGQRPATGRRRPGRAGHLVVLSAAPGGAAGPGGRLPVSGSRVPRRRLGLPEPGWLPRRAGSQQG